MIQLQSSINMYLVIPVVAGERAPRDEMPVDSDSSDEEATTPDEDNRHQLTELQQMFSDVVAIINSLYRLSMTIRNAAPHDRLVKAASVDTTFYETWDIEHVKNKFPIAKVSYKFPTYSCWSLISHRNS